MGITAGEYRTDSRRYVARHTAGRLRLHWVNRTGRVSRYAVAVVTDGIATVTDNGRSHAGHIAQINAGGCQVTAHCTDCHHILTDPRSVELGTGPVCQQRRAA